MSTSYRDLKVNFPTRNFPAIFFFPLSQENAISPNLDGKSFYCSFFVACLKTAGKMENRRKIRRKLERRENDREIPQMK